jgi:hypothetical protein
MMDRYLSALLTSAFVLLLNAPVILAEEASLTRSEARTLVLAQLKHEGYDIASPKFELDDNKLWAPGYYSFDAYFDAPDRLAHIDWYSVDPRNAELWDDGLCMKIETPSVRQLQNKLRAERSLPLSSTQKYAPCDTYMNSN